MCSCKEESWVLGPKVAGMYFFQYSSNEWEATGQL